MELKRKPFQGVLNIIHFNWHFYLIACISLIVIFSFKFILPEPFQFLVFCFALLAIVTTAVSLLISFYVYDLSDLYALNWLLSSDKKHLLNINAGFDETSEIIKSKFPYSELIICDFYDPQRHTEISIKRARRAYPPLSGTILVSTAQLPFQDNNFDYSVAVLSAHEIRKEKERVEFFKELNRVTKSTGQIFVTEHLRDWKNFIAYSFGIFHFHSRSSWLRTFKQANLTVHQEIKTTPFITTFILVPNGDTL